MSAGWINAHVTAAPYTYPHWYGGLGPGDIIADEVTRRLRATTAPWGSSNTLLSWFTDDNRIQRVHLLDRGDFTATPALCVYLAARNHLEAPGSLDVNTVRLEIAVVAETASLAGVLTDGTASVETVLSYIKRFLAYPNTRNLQVTINSANFQLVKSPVVFGQVGLVPAVGGQDGISAWILPIEYGIDVDMPSGQITNLAINDPNA